MNSILHGNGVLKGCNVCWTRSYQRVAEKVNHSLKGNNKKEADETFCNIGKAILYAKEKQGVLRLFNALQGTATLASVQNLAEFSDEMKRC